MTKAYPLQCGGTLYPKPVTHSEAVKVAKEHAKLARISGVTVRVFLHQTEQKITDSLDFPLPRWVASFDHTALKR